MWDLPDEIFHNIFARLPAKPLSLSRCVSKHWNRIISDPYFMKSRPSRRKTLIFSPRITVFGGTEPAVHDYLAHSRRFADYLSKNLKSEDVNIVGTFNGIVFLVGRKRSHYVEPEVTVYYTYHMMLYNPFTGEFKILPDPYSTTDDKYRLHGFCYGATMDDDLKIVRFREYKGRSDYSWKTCDVINLKTCSWSTSEIPIQDAKLYKRDRSGVGIFVNGFLCWLAEKKVVALNVEETVISEIYLPFPDNVALILGTLHGCLCMITPKSNDFFDDECDECYEGGFNVWVMKKEHGAENPWSILHSFDFLHECDHRPLFRIIKTMGDGRILVADWSMHVFIFDTFTNSYNKLNTSRSLGLYSASAIEYDESLISPSWSLNLRDL